MRNRNLFLVGLLVCIGSLGVASQLSLGFVAPQVSGKANVSNPTNGEIVFDANDGAFWGYDGSSWNTLGASGQTNPRIAEPTTTYTALVTDDVIMANANSAAFTVTLPAASTCKSFQIQKTDSTFNAVTIASSGSDTINGGSTTTVNTQYEVITLVTDSTCDNWHILNRNYPQTWNSYTPTFAGMTPTNKDFHWRRVGDSMEIKGRFTAGSVAASVLSISLPSGTSIDTNKASTSWGYNSGWILRAVVSTATVGAAIISTTDSTTAFFRCPSLVAGSNNPLTRENGNNSFVNGEAGTVNGVVIPISGWN